MREEILLSWLDMANLLVYCGAARVQLSPDEAESLRSQTVISNAAGVGVGRGGRRTAPYAFTEHGALMAANLLNSPRAVAMTVYKEDAVPYRTK